MNILVTGASGFVGKRLCAQLALSPWRVRQVFRQPQPSSNHSSRSESIHVAEVGPFTDWRDALNGIDRVVHLAARVHVMSDLSVNPLAEFRRVNVDATINLAQQAAAAGVKRFVFISSIKVNGETTAPNFCFRQDTPPAPEDPYGVSKLEAEQALGHIARQTGMAVVIIRPPLVYGPGVKANFESMMRWLARGIPLPFAAITQNQRSLVALDNLVDLIVTCLSHQAAANQTFLISDGEDLSTAELLRRMGDALGKPARLVAVPNSLLRFAAMLIKKDSVYQRLCESLQVDISHTRQLLNWTPPLSVYEGLRLTAEGFRA